MKIFYHSDCLLHNPPYEILDGMQTPYQECPSRITIVKDTLAAQPEHFDLSDQLDESLDLKRWILKVHEPEYLEYLETAYENWISDGGDEMAIFPETFPHISMLSKKPLNPSKLSPIARAGLYCFDLSCPITKDTFKSVLASLRVTLTAGKTLLSLRPGEGVFALCRPPGHHAMHSLSGGYCFINNVAVTARYLQATLESQSKLAILDIDYHHGNGTQDVFYTDPSVLTHLIFGIKLIGVSCMDFTGFTSETGEGEGEGFTINIPLLQGTTGDHEYCEALTRAAGQIEDFNAAYLLVSLVVDTHEKDPICNFRISTEGYLKIGEIISSLKKPTLFVFEGGYHLESIGYNVRNVLCGFQESNSN